MDGQSGEDGEGLNHDVCNGKRMRCVCSVRCVFAQVMLGVRLSEDDGPPCWRLCCPSRDREGFSVEPGGNHRTVTQTHALRGVLRSQEMHLRHASQLTASDRLTRDSRGKER